MSLVCQDKRKRSQRPPRQRAVSRQSGYKLFGFISFDWMEFGQQNNNNKNTATFFLWGAQTIESVQKSREYKENIHRITLKWQ